MNTKMDFGNTNLAMNLWEHSHDDVKALLNLTENWDGEGASPVQRSLIHPALEFLKYCESANMLPPSYVYATAGGTIMIEFHDADGAYISANIRKPGVAEIIIRTETGEPDFVVFNYGKPSETETSAVENRVDSADSSPDCDYRLAS